MPPWTVTLICGASGVGKSRVAIPVARRYGVPMGEADDVVTALKALTTGREQPALHYSDLHPETRSWPADRIAALHLEVAEALRAGYEAVIADHIAFRAPVLLEGDYLIPELAVEFSGSVRAVVVCEPDEDQVVANHLAREPDAGEQRLRARVRQDPDSARAACEQGPRARGSRQALGQRARTSRPGCARRPPLKPLVAVTWAWPTTAAPR